MRELRREEMLPDPPKVGEKDKKEEGLTRLQFIKRAAGGLAALGAFGGAMEYLGQKEADKRDGERLRDQILMKEMEEENRQKLQDIIEEGKLREKISDKDLLSFDQSHFEITLNDADALEEHWRQTYEPHGVRRGDFEEALERFEDWDELVNREFERAG